VTAFRRARRLSRARRENPAAHRQSSFQSDQAHELLALRARGKLKPQRSFADEVILAFRDNARDAHIERRGAPIRVVAAVIFGILLTLTLVLGPMIARQDLRADLSNSDILKTYPLRGWQIALGELLTPLFILSVLIWLCLLAEFLLLPHDKPIWLTPSLRAGAALGLAVLVPPFVAIQLLVPNAAAVLFPAWVHLAGDRTDAGIEVMGQRLIFVAGQLLATAVAIVPAAITAAVIFFVGQWLAGFAVAAALAVAAVFILLATEALLGVRWVGSRFEQLDLSAELRP
jgi:hypothetical protein